MLKLRFLTLFSTIVFASISLQAKGATPRLLKAPEIATEADAKPINMTNGRFSWTHNGKVIVLGAYTDKDNYSNFYSTLAYENSLPEELSSDDKDLFFQKTIDGSDLLCLVKWHPNKPKNKDAANNVPFAGIIETPTHTIEKKPTQRKFEPEHQRYKTLSESECANFIIKNRVLFLTGSGISLSSGIQTMQHLEKSLGISRTEPVDEFVGNFIHKPKVIWTALNRFIKSLKATTPSKAHIALKNLALYKGTHVLTGNFDALHAASGIKPYMVEWEDVPKDFTEEVAKEVAGMVCIGSSYDFQGVLNLYKTFNPDGTIIAINKEAPDYIGDDDFLVQGDVQEILPNIEKMVFGDEQESSSECAN